MQITPTLQISSYPRSKRTTNYNRQQSFTGGVSELASDITHTTGTLETLSQEFQNKKGGISIRWRYVARLEGLVHNLIVLAKAQEAEIKRLHELLKVK